LTERVDAHYLVGTVTACKTLCRVMAAKKELLKSIIDKRDRNLILFVQQQFSDLRNQHAEYHEKTIEKIEKLYRECSVNCLQNYQNKIKTQ